MFKSKSTLSSSTSSVGATESEVTSVAKTTHEPQPSDSPSSSDNVKSVGASADTSPRNSRRLFQKKASRLPRPTNTPETGDFEEGGRSIISMSLGVSTIDTSKFQSANPSCRSAPSTRAVAPRRSESTHERSTTSSRPITKAPAAPKEVPRLGISAVSVSMMPPPDSRGARQVPDTSTAASNVPVKMAALLSTQG